MGNDKMMEYETFYDELKAFNDGKVLRVTVPDKLVRFCGFKPGDSVKVLIIRKDKKNTKK